MRRRSDPHDYPPRRVCESAQTRVQRAHHNVSKSVLSFTRFFACR